MGLCTARSHGNEKNGNCKHKSRVQKLANCTLRDLAAKLDVHDRLCMLSYLSSLPISFYVLVVWILRLNFFKPQYPNYVKLKLEPPLPPPSNFIAGCPKVALLFWFIRDFRCDVPLFIIIFVIYK